jgi:hypothetical protein
MPKPFAHLTGNGCHAHVSLWDREGRTNLFLDAADEAGLSALAYSFLGGILAAADRWPPCSIRSSTATSGSMLDRPSPEPRGRRTLSLMAATTARTWYEFPNPAVSSSDWRTVRSTRICCKRGYSQPVLTGLPTSAIRVNGSTSTCTRRPARRRNRSGVCRQICWMHCAPSMPAPLCGGPWLEFRGFIRKVAHG